MAKPINNADAAQALVRAYSLKGRVQLQLDELVVPVAIVDDLRPQPLVRPCGLVVEVTGVAAQFSYAIAETVLGLALAVESIIIRNGAAANREFFIRLFTAAEIATIGLASSTLRVKDIPVDATQVASTAGAGTDGSVRGSSIIHVALLPNTTMIVPVGATIYGVANPARAGIGVQGTTVAAGMTCSFVCVERNV